MNAIYNSATDERCDMKNTSLRVFSDVLALALSDLAETDAQRDLTIELLHCMDQEFVGMGCSYIDVTKLPWGSDFSAQQTFLLQALDKAASRHRWSDLPYEPNTETTDANIRAVRSVIEKFDRTQLVAEEFETVESYILCPIHAVLEHSYGCVVCHNNR